MIVCVCRRISDREIARHAHAGLDFDEIQFELGVATECGRCESCARDVVAQCHAAQLPLATLPHLHDAAKAAAQQTIELANTLLESKPWPSHSCAQSQVA
ncbi:(2Fe-2S)-binding protein [Verminephrobacter aporrectodeae]|uniref:(2Fe-2S)-binding protein n=1 Tax=Verminephrobacter aporrectodeae TaxID=1110389 RepID=UPI002238A891|nr:(2Fe-2S)-binding protein [Verminephrobacter aporrectodeae]MCW5221264.1 (2Fe-2S)-binding protein [Verminephrobacter aporrectodeae subsp. tuberculatae]MCW5290555.1 (2Fe-2S)-binding protein [Verminephrobacter aporrectodeae subsp. tuberculatae]MCW8166576.1 (2Fe-2S)-binding protein [Verminephrobacter aporrectodeae subsp. tuberculatae]MCW8170742.1 (2Fe-2S)-binding protein [Verminephrobacter aporrectodeae subsp. tuberculatae]MCW8177216.1 (2Fe-2S)-binding protein [Verminephrobacter aporrectodeae su